MQDTKQLIEDLDSMKSLLVDAATYGGYEGGLDEKRYAEIRTKILEVVRLQVYLPTFLRSRPRLSDFRLLAQEKGGYSLRRAFITESFAPVLDYLHEELQNPIGTPITEALTKIESPHIVKACEKAMDRVYDDPDGAITSARSLLETV